MTGTFEFRTGVPLIREEVERVITTPPRVMIMTPDAGERASPPMPPALPMPPAAPAAPAGRTVRGRVITI
jgi:hypothetical protein